MNPEEISVIGAGAWGTAIAHHIASKNSPVVIWAYEKEVVQEINREHKNSTFLPGFELHKTIRATNNLEEVCKNRIVFFVVPSHVMEGIVKSASPHLTGDTIIVSATKGIENDRLRLPSQILQEHLPEGAAKKLVCLSGPSFAKEVMMGHPTLITAASGDHDSAVAVQKLMSNDRMRVYTHDDIIGVEVGGAVKNVLAIAAGISDGLGYGHNARAAIITRGLAEMKRLGERLGGKESSFMGLSGIGDLLLTASGELSRNRTIGFRLGKGEKIADVMADAKTVAEGVRTSRSIHELSQKVSVEMPICNEVYYVCHENKNPKEAANYLMTRRLKEEF